jgi:tryptophan synthase alpha chain
MHPSWSAARLDYALATSRSEQRAALGLYLPVGYPSRTASLDALHLMAQHADVLELGLPHSDPHMDGPVIREACAQALDSGFEMIDLFTAATELTAATTTALVVMSYWAPIARFGPELFAERLAVAGGAGVLIPDLPEREAATWHWAAREAGLHTIPLVPAHASNARLAEIGSASSGMVYAPATPGRTWRSTTAQPVSAAPGATPPLCDRPARGGRYRHQHPRAGRPGVHVRGRRGGRLSRDPPHADLEQRPRPGCRSSRQDLR